MKNNDYTWILLVILKSMAKIWYDYQANNNIANTESLTTFCLGHYSNMSNMTKFRPCPDLAMAKFWRGQPGFASKHAAYSYIHV